MSVTAICSASESSFIGTHTLEAAAFLSFVVLCFTACFFLLVVVLVWQAAEAAEAAVVATVAAAVCSGVEEDTAVLAAVRAGLPFVASLLLFLETNTNGCDDDTFVVVVA